MLIAHCVGWGGGREGEDGGWWWWLVVVAGGDWWLVCLDDGADGLLDLLDAGADGLLEGLAGELCLLPLVLEEDVELLEVAADVVLEGAGEHLEERVVEEVVAGVAEREGQVVDVALDLLHAEEVGGLGHGTEGDDEIEAAAADVERGASLVPH